MRIIDRNRVINLPKMKRTVVAIDPAVTANADSDETGIVVCGIDKNNVGYVLADYSGRFSPSKWAQEALKAKNAWNADYYVAEVNQGGDMVENIIKQRDHSAFVKSVRAKKGKYLRAEPIYGLYEEGKINHFGKHDLLESQMTTFNPTDPKSSPDRLDALVWGFTDLMLNRKDIIVI